MLVLRRLGFVIFHLKREIVGVSKLLLLSREIGFILAQMIKRFLQPHCKIKKKYDLCVHDVVVSVKDHDKRCT